MLVALGDLHTAQDRRLPQSARDEFGLDRARVDAPAVQVSPDFGCNRHVLFGLVGRAVDEHVHRGNNLALGQLPNVQLVEVENAIDILDRLADGFERNRRRHSLEQDVRGGLAEGESRVEDNDGDEERDGGVRVETPPCVRVQDEEAGGDNTDVAERVPQHVKEDTLHVHTAFTVAVAAVRVAMTGSIVAIGTLRVVSMRIVIVRVPILESRRGSTSFEVSVGIRGTVVIGSVGEKASALVLCAAERGDGVRVLVPASLVAEIVCRLDDKGTGLSRVAEDGSDTVLTATTALGNRAADSTIFIGGGIGLLLAADGDGTDSIADGGLVLVIAVGNGVAVGVIMATMAVTAVTVRMAMSAMSMTVVVEEEKTYEVAS